MDTAGGEPTIEGDGGAETSGVLRALFLPPARAAAALAICAAGSGLCFLLAPPDRWLAGAVLSIGLAWAAMVDLDRMILPNLLTLGLLGAGLAEAALWRPDDFVHRLVGAAAGYVALSAVADLYRRGRGRAGLGAGDAKLFAAGGAWAGWANLPHILLAASAGALLAVLALTWLAGRRIGPTDRLAFGPYLAAGIWAAWLAGAA